jgi:hypothetical protein
MIQQKSRGTNPGCLGGNESRVMPLFRHRLPEVPPFHFSALLFPRAFPENNEFQAISQGVKRLRHISSRGKCSEMLGFLQGLIFSAFAALTFPLLLILWASYSRAYQERPSGFQTAANGFCSREFVRYHVHPSGGRRSIHIRPRPSAVLPQKLRPLTGRSQQPNMAQRCEWKTGGKNFTEANSHNGEEKWRK